MTKPSPSKTLELRNALERFICDIGGEVKHVGMFLDGSFANLSICVGEVEYKLSIMVVKKKKTWRDYFSE